MDDNENINEETEVTVEQHVPVGAEAHDDGGAEQQGQPYSPDDAMLERAVKAGMSLADAKALPNKEFAERMLSALENRSGVNGGGEAAHGDESPMPDFSGFGEAEGYDPTLVKVLTSLKTTVEAQARELAEYRKIAKAPNKTKAVESRKNLTLARPVGERGATRAATPENAEAALVSELREKFKLT